MRFILALLLCLLPACGSDETRKEESSEDLLLAVVRTSECEYSTEVLYQAFQDCAVEWKETYGENLKILSWSDEQYPYEELQGAGQLDIYWHYYKRFDGPTIVFLPAHVIVEANGLGMPELAIVWTFGNYENVRDVICHELKHLYAKEDSYHA